MTRLPEVAVGGVAVRNGDQILLVCRRNAPAAGCWSVPGGRVRFGESTGAAVVREVYEETGLEVVVERFLGWVEWIADDPESYHYVILDFLVNVRDPDLDPTAGDDALDARWVRFEDLYTAGGRAGLPLVPGLLGFLEQTSVVHSP